MHAPRHALHPVFLLFLAVLPLAWRTAGATSEGPALSLTAVAEWPTLPAGWTLEETAGVAVDARGHVFVFHRGPRPIIEFDPTGRVVRTWGDGTYVRPHALKFDHEGRLWAVDDGGHFVAQLDAAGRARLVLGRKGAPGETEDTFNRPTDIAFSPNGDLYVTDGYGNARVVQFTAEGRFVRAWGKKGKGPGEFDLPHAIAVARDGRVLVGDRNNFRIQIFTPDGKFLAEWTHAGSPWGLCLAPDDTLWMCDGYANRIVQLGPDGRVLGTAAGPGKLPGRLDFAHHLALGPDGSLFVAEIKNWRVQKFTQR